METGGFFFWETTRMRGNRFCLWHDLELFFLLLEKSGNGIFGFLYKIHGENL